MSTASDFSAVEAASPAASRRALPVLPTLVALLLFAGLLGLYFSRHFVPGMLDSSGMDTVQSARILARTGKLSTNVVRPLLTSRLAVNGDGTSPDFAHAPLYSALIAASLRITHQTGADQGDREATLVTLALYAAATAATYALARRLFRARRFGGAAASVGALFFAFGGTALTGASTLQPSILGALLFALLLLALWNLDGQGASAEDDNAPRAPRALAAQAALAGALFGLLFLTVYSSLLILPALLVYLFSASGGRRQGSRAPLAIALFLGAALLVAAPLLIRNTRLAHNPFYNAHLVDLVEDTASFPGEGLVGVAVPPRSLSQYLAEGGVGEIAAKAARNLGGVCGAVPLALGLFVTPLFFVSALSRFADRRINRLRTLVYVCLGCHLVGLAPFESAAQSVPVVLLYAPFAAALAAGFLHSLLQARRLPAFYAQASLVGWTAVACLPGLVQIVAQPPLAVNVASYGVYAFLNNNSDKMARLRASGAYLITDAPDVAAYRLDVPVVYLPVDASDMQTVEARTGRQIGCILLTPALNRHDPTDPSTALWLQTYHQIIALDEVVTHMDARMGLSVVKQTHLLYPATIAAGMRGFGVPAPYAERGGTEYALLFWKAGAINPPSAKSGAGTPANIKP